MQVILGNHEARSEASKDLPVKGARGTHECESWSGGRFSLRVLFHEEKAASTAREKVLTKKTHDFSVLHDSMLIKCVFPTFHVRV